LNSENIKLLIVDDEEQMRKVLSYIIKNSKYSDLNIDEAASAEEAINILDKKEYEIAICDYLLTNMSGIELFSKSAITNPYCVRILISGNVNYDELRNAISRGDIFKFISKPFDEEEIINVLDEAIKKVKENRLKRDLVQRLKDF